MAQLLLDYGNTQLKAALLQDRQVNHIGQGKQINLLLDAVATSPGHIWLSSVANRANTQKLLAMLQQRWPVPIQQVRVAAYQQHLPTVYAIDQLGVDRWLAMLACYENKQQAYLVVDCGTAITLDLVEKGQHMGGYILPGLHLMQQSLLSQTAIPWPEDADKANDQLAKNTRAAVQKGSQQAVVALIEKMCPTNNTKLFIGGGDADKISRMLAIPYINMQQMVICGLAQLARLETT